MVLLFELMVFTDWTKRETSSKMPNSTHHELARRKKSLLKKIAFLVFSFPSADKIAFEKN